MKLYLVAIKGRYNAVGTDYSEAYVVAENTDKAYKIYRDFLDKEDLCFDSDRELKSIELLAEDAKYPDCQKLLFMQKKGGK